MAVALSGLAVPTVASAAVGVPVTYMGHVYTAARPPSADKPQSKLWHHDGSWWALMVEAGGTRTFIHELLDDHTWRNTGALVDGRAESTGDALWSSTHGRLYVASRAPAVNLQVNAFTYDSSTRSWAGAADFPVTVNSGGSSESATIDQDTTGRLWVTYTRSSKVWVANSDTAGGGWSAGYNPAVADTAVASDDLSALIAFRGRIGVLYSDQAAGAFRLAIHDDGDPIDVWSFESFSLGPSFADDHINLKQLVGDEQGRLFAAIKTSNGDDPADPPDAPLVGVITYTPPASGSGGGSWAFAQAGTVADDHSRPIIMVDSTNKELYFFATAPVTGGDIFYKKAPLSDISFGPGRGTPFIDAPYVVNNATGAKEPVTADTGLVILAVAHGKKQYAHAEMELAGAGGGQQPPPSDPAPVVTSRSPAADATGVPPADNVTATFSETVQGVGDTTFTLRTSAGAAVSATVGYDPASRTATLDPGADLAAGTQYTATLTGGSTAIRDLADNPLATTSWSFTTASSSPPPSTGAPTVKQPTTPPSDAVGVSPTANVVVTFNEAVLGVDATTFTLTDLTTGAGVPAAVTRYKTSNKYVLNPSATLPADTRYRVTLTGGPSAIRDTGGTALVTTSFEFLTGPRPTVKSRTPAVNATGVSRGANVTATFSEAVQGVSGTTFVLRDPGGNVVSAALRAGTTNQWILDPAAALAASSTYTATITTGVRDAAGNPLIRDQIWSFTTGAT